MFDEYKKLISADLFEQVSAQVSSVFDKFPEYSAPKAFEQHSKGKFMNVALLNNSALIFENEIKTIKATHSFSVNRVTFIAYESEDNYFFIFCTIYHLFLGVFLPDGTFVQDYSESDVLGYKINIDNLKSKIKTFVLNQDAPKKVLLFGTAGNIGHHIWNEQTGLDFLLQLDLLKEFDEVWLGNSDFLNFRKYFEKLGLKVVDKSSYFNENKVLSVNGVLIRAEELFFLSVTRDRLKKWIFENAAKTEELKSPVVGIQIRQNSRIWVSEIEGVAALIKDINQKYPEVSFVIDGFGKSYAPINREEDFIKKDNDAYLKIRELVPDNIKIVSAIGMLLNDKLSLLSKIDVVLSPIGSAGVCIYWLLQKDVISYGPLCYYDWTCSDSNSLVEDIAKDELFFLPKEFIKMQENNLDYDFDWRNIRPFLYSRLEKFSKPNV